MELTSKPSRKPFIERDIAIVKSILASVAYDIAGGYPRDLYYGAEPKDADFWVYPMENPLDRSALSYALQEDSGIAFESFLMYGEVDNPNTASIDFVLRSEYVDVIFLNEQCTHTVELLDRFDCNINRFTMCGDTPLYVGVNLDGLATFVPPEEYIQQHITTEKRMAKMRAKFTELTGRPA